MTENPKAIVKLTSAQNEEQAAIIVAALDELGVEAQTVGALTSRLRVGAPGDVDVLVQGADLEQAQAALRTIQKRGKERD